MSKTTVTAYSQILQLLKPYRWNVFWAVILALLPGYFTVWSPYILGRLIDQGLVLQDMHAFWALAVVILGIKCILFFVKASVTYCLAAFGLQILVDYRDQLLSRILRYPARFFDKISSGTLTTRLTSDVNAVQELFSTALVPLIGNIFLIFGVMVSMFIIEWRLALAALSVCPLLIWLTVSFDHRIRRRFGFMRSTLSSLNSFSAETFSGQREVRVLGAVERVKSEFLSLSHRLQTRNIKAVREYALYNPMVPFLTAMMDVVILGFGGYLVLHQQMTVGEVVAFLGYASLFAWPVRDFAEKYTVLQQALAAVDRLLEVSDHPLEDDHGKEILSESVKIEFDRVTFAYESRAGNAVENLSFSVAAGEKVALLGETGSGKTTTCGLLMRFYKPSEGRILLNGRPIEDYSLETLRSGLGWVSQDVFLFSLSLRENIRLYRDISDEEIWRALEIVQLKRWVQSLPGGLDFVFMERASSLSSGQRQLLSLARALVLKPRILIFDEATSYVDSLTEFQFQRALEQLWRSDALHGVTCFFIAHRLSTLRRCDRMLVFREGRIMEQGTFDHLMSIKGGYAADLFSQQFKKIAEASSVG